MLSGLLYLMVNILSETGIVLFGLLSRILDILLAILICVTWLTVYVLNVHDFEMSDVQINKYIENNQESQHPTSKLINRVHNMASKMNVRSPRSIIINPNHNGIMLKELKFVRSKIALVFPTDTPTNYMIVHGLVLVEFFYYLLVNLKYLLFSIRSCILPVFYLLLHSL